jgi:hypothetical protein
MDVASLVTPGAQSLVAAILSDSWAQLRSALSRLWARRHADDAAGPDRAAIEHAGRELDAAREQALALAGAADSADPADRGARMQLFLAGYLAGQLAARPELADAVAALPALLGGDPAAGASSTLDSSVVRNSITGTVRGNAVQARDIEGGVSFR